MLLSSWIKPTENATVIEWKKTKSVMTTLSMSSNPVFFLVQLGIWFTASYFIRWYMAYTAGVCFEQASRVKCVAACVWLWKQTNSSLKWTSKVVSYHHFLQGGHLSRATVINISNSGLKELSLTLLSRANSSMRSQKAPAVTLFGHFDFKCELGTVQKRIELWESFKGHNCSY